MGSYNILSNKKKETLPQTGLPSILTNIKSKFILKGIFNYLQEKKILEIFRYNKGIKNRLNIDLDNYKNFTPIEMELTVQQVEDEFVLFINRLGKAEKFFYHIYFNNSKEETKRRYLKKNERVKKIRIIIDYPKLSFEHLFSDCKYIETINFKKFDRRKITNMSHMFYNCSSLKKIKFSNFKTNNVTDMSYMFYGCRALEKLELSNFSTNNVTNMNHMFFGCYSLKKLNLSNFNTSNVNSMNYMFYKCISLIELNLTNFNVNNVTDMSYMFYGCSSLKKLNLSNFNIDKVKFMTNMFSKCSDELKNKIRNQFINIKKEAFL